MARRGLAEATLQPRGLPIQIRSPRVHNVSSLENLSGRFVAI